MSANPHFAQLENVEINIYGNRRTGERSVTEIANSIHRLDPGRAKIGPENRTEGVDRDPMRVEDKKSELL